MVGHFYPSYALTDCGNAERLVDQHGGGIRFCADTREWFVWDGRRWVPGQGAVVQLAKKTVRAIHHERTRILVESERYPERWDLLKRHADALSKWQMRSESASSITAMIRMGESDPRVTAASGSFDADPWLLNVPNGTIDLRFQQFREHRPEDLQTKLAGAAYDPNAVCPRWEGFLQEVFEPHPELAAFMQRAVGYTLTGSTREECVFVLVGGGRNGKSTLIRVLESVLGDYAGLAEIETFITGRGHHLREDIADMRGRRFVSAQEPSIGSAFAESTLKWVSGGDSLRARRLYEHAREFRPSHKLWLSVNRLPTIPDADRAAWSRLRIVPFDVSFEGRGDPRLKANLVRESSGILMWALRGCARWLRGGLGVPTSIRKAGRHWRAAQAKTA